jgi:hypothetical protein
VRLGKNLVAIVGATVLLCVLVGAASANNTLSSSTQSIEVTWTRLNFSGGFGTIECEITLRGTLHARTFAKVPGVLIGYWTAANVPRCIRGGSTIARETLPWHIRYRGFVGFLPNIAAFAADHTYVARKREPSFGVTCTAIASASSPMISTFNREASGRITSVTESGSVPCSGALNVIGSFSGTSSTVSAMTVTLI